MMAEMIHMSQEVFDFEPGWGGGKDGVWNALPHTSLGERTHASSSGLRPRFLRIDSPLSSIRYEL